MTIPMRTVRRSSLMAMMISMRATTSIGSSTTTTTMSNPIEYTFLVLESGEYSDYTYHAFIKVPKDVDIDEAYTAAYLSMLELDSSRDETHFSVSDIIPQFMKALIDRGGEEVDYQAIHLGDYSPKTPTQIKSERL